MTPALLLSLALAQSPETTLLYTAKRVEEGAPPRTLDSYDFTLFEPSTKADLFVGVDEANLRQSASADAAVVTTVPLGAAVRVLERGKERLKVGEYVNHWYSVEYVDTQGTPAPGDDQRFSGWLFGNTLTPFRFEADLDGDGEKEVATVVMSADFKVRVRVLEPNVKPPRRVSSVDTVPAGQAYLGVDGGQARVTLVPAKKAGVALLQVDSSPEACGDYSTNYVSYTVPGRKKGVLGRAKVALELNGLSDPPTLSTFEVSFQSKKQGLTVVRSNSEEMDDEGNPTKETRERTRYALKDGVYMQVDAAGNVVADDAKQ
ncbi:MAG TPA: SH3 domain-containing protein [Myxococcus sp.]|nr:SH3 domain-containing protein [Myxococcus sp.]